MILKNLLLELSKNSIDHPMNYFLNFPKAIVIFVMAISLPLFQASGEEANNAVKAKEAKIGEQVKFEDSTWVVLSAHEIGDRLGDLHSEDGKFVYVKYKVTNETNSEEQILFAPSVKDSRGRRYEELEDLVNYLKEGEKGMMQAPLPAGLGKVFVSIFEMPKNSEGIVFLTRSLGIEKTEKPVALELELAKKKEEEKQQKMAKEESARVQAESERNNAEQLKAKEARLAEIEKIDVRLKELTLIWQQDTAIINRLTNFKKTPVREGTKEYFICLESSKRIQQAEAEAKTLKEKKAKLISLNENVASSQHDGDKAENDEVQKILSEMKKIEEAFKNGTMSFEDADRMLKALAYKLGDAKERASRLDVK